MCVCVCVCAGIAFGVLSADAKSVKIVGVTGRPIPAQDLMDTATYDSFEAVRLLREPPQPSTGGSDGLSPGAIAGIVIGAVVGTALLAAVIAVFVIRYNKKKSWEEFCRQHDSSGVYDTHTHTHARAHTYSSANLVRPIARVLVALCDMAVHMYVQRRHGHMLLAARLCTVLSAHVCARCLPLKCLSAWPALCVHARQVPSPWLVCERTSRLTPSRFRPRSLACSK